MLVLTNEKNRPIDTKYPFVFRKDFLGYCQHSNLEYLLISDENNEVYLPIVISKSKFIKILTILHPPLKNGKSISYEEEEMFFNELIYFVKKKKFADRIKYPMHLGVFKSAPANASSISFGLIEADLSQELDELFMKFKKNYRNEIRKCIKEGVEIKFGEDQFEPFYKVYQETMKRNDLFLESEGALDSFKNGMKDNSGTICAVAYYKGEVLGGALVPYSTYGGFYLYGGSSEKQKIVGGLKLMHWEIMKVLKEKGANKYILGGARLQEAENSKYTGIQRFKLGFGSELKEGVIWKLDVNKLKCKVYDLMFRIKYGSLESI